MPQPIDAQSELARLALLQRAQDLAERAATAQALRDRAEAERLRGEAERTVNQTHEAQSEHIDEDGRRKNPFVSRRKKRRTSQDALDDPAKVFYSAKNKAERADDLDGQQLDVTI